MESELDKDIFMLIDGSAIIHRAYHAMPNFTTLEGIPTGAVYGFFSMVLKLMHHIKPAHVAVAFDRGKPTFRQTLYAGYHANRPRSSQEFKDQYQMIRELLQEMSVATYEVDGFEADDVIGTVNQKLNNDYEIPVYIVTGDRDMLQLVDNDTKVLMPVKGISEVMLYDEVRVKTKFGVRPDQIIDLKAFMGDASDNYPGVPGVGLKTAMRLLQQYDHFEQVFENITEIEAKNPKLAKKLAEGSDQAYLAKTLATIDTSVPFVFDLEECNIERVSRENMKDALSKYEFKSLMNRVDELFDGKESKTQMKLI